MTVEEEHNMFINAIRSIEKTNDMVTSKMAQIYLNCSATTVRRWFKRLRLREVKLNGAWYYSVYHLEIVRLTRKHQRAILEYWKMQREQGATDNE